eukprot:68262-Prorocentrum_minimum.AAC.1
MGMLASPKPCNRRSFSLPIGSRPGYLHPSVLRLVPVPGISTRPSSNWFPSRAYPPVPPPTGSRPGHIHPSLLRLVPVPGISTRPSSDWFPSRAYPPVPPPIGSRPGHIHPSLLRLVPVTGISSRPSSDWFRVCLRLFAVAAAAAAAVPAGVPVAHGGPQRQGGRLRAGHVGEAPGALRLVPRIAAGGLDVPSGDLPGQGALCRGAVQEPVPRDGDGDGGGE